MHDTRQHPETRGLLVRVAELVRVGQFAFSILLLFRRRPQYSSTQVTMVSAPALVCSAKGLCKCPPRGYTSVQVCLKVSFFPKSESSPSRWDPRAQVRGGGEGRRGAEFCLQRP